VFIYFLEQVWDYNSAIQFLNFETNEIQRSYWGVNRKSCYPTKYMEEGNDYIDY